MDECLNYENWLCQLTYLVAFSHNLVKSAVLNSDENSFTAQKGILIKITISKYYIEKDCFINYILKDNLNFPNPYRCFRSNRVLHGRLSRSLTFAHEFQDWRINFLGGRKASLNFDSECVEF